MKKIMCFDLDGVFLSDTNYSKIHSEEEYNQFRYDVIENIFNLEMPFYIITGRPSQDREWTEKWLQRNNIKPEKLFHDNLDYKKSAQYKSDVLRYLTITNINTEFIFVESSYQQCVYIMKQQIPNVGVYHFESLLKRIFTDISTGEYV